MLGGAKYVAVTGVAPWATRPVPFWETSVTVMVMGFGPSVIWTWTAETRSPSTWQSVVEERPTESVPWEGSRKGVGLPAMRKISSIALVVPTLCRVGGWRKISSSLSP